MIETTIPAIAVGALLLTGLLVYETETRKHLFSTGALIGKSHHHYYTVLGFFQWVRSDLPEKP